MVTLISVQQNLLSYSNNLIKAQKNVDRNDLFECIGRLEINVKKSLVLNITTE